MNNSVKKILIVGPLPPPHHGVTEYTQDLLQSGLRSCFEILHLDTSDRRNLDNLGKLEFTNIFLALRNEVQLVRRLLFDHPAIVYVPTSQNNLGFFRDGLFILTTKILSKAQIVIHHHGGEYFTQFMQQTNFFMKWYVGFVLRKVDLGIVLGERLRPVLSGLVKRVEVVPHGIRLNEDLSMNKRQPKNGLTVSFLGNLFKAKGILDVVEAAKILVQPYPKMKFRFAGTWWGQEPETKEEAFKIIRENDLSGKIEFVGFVQGQQKVDFLSDTDIFVSPSWHEGLGLVNLEAMAAGCPVISSKGVGAIPEIVLDGITGILVEPKHPEQIVEAIIRLAEDPELRRQMGSAGRRRVYDYYTFETHIECMSTVFRTLTEGV
jgi:glycosyltransferase involved in cell wall biosynthesis